MKNSFGFYKIFRHKAGFTLVELMVTVFVVGILATVAIPSYRKNQAKARHVFAKIELSALYAAEMSISAETGMFSECLCDIGYALPQGPRYYVVGFRGCLSVCGPYSNRPCNSTYTKAGTEVGCSCGYNVGGYYWPATTSAYGYSAEQLRWTDRWIIDPEESNSLTNTTFTVHAAGNILSGTTEIDKWSIDHEGDMIQRPTLTFPASF